MSRKKQPHEIVHGTLNGYTRHKCRCPDCKEAMAAYGRAKRGTKPEDYMGPSVRLNMEALTAAMDSDGRTPDELAVAFGYALRTSLAHVMERGTAPLYRVDTMACALGMHMSQLLADPSEAWDAA